MDTFQSYPDISSRCPLVLPLHSQYHRVGYISQPLLLQRDAKVCIGQKFWRFWLLLIMSRRQGAVTADSRRRRLREFMLGPLF